jgi:uncharacterized protein
MKKIRPGRGNEESTTLRKSPQVTMLKAVTDGNVRAVRSCLDSGVQVDARLGVRPNRPAQETFLMLAAEKGRSRVVELLLSRGANVDATNDLGQPALLYAARNNQTSIVSTLLKVGANPNLRWAGRDFLLREVACAGIDLRMTRLLLKYGADASAMNSQRRTALHMAAHQGRTDIARLLVKAGADINGRDSFGHGPVTCAVAGKHLDTVRFLLGAGADPKRQPEALGLAAWEGKREFIRLLIAYGFDVNSKAHQGRTPLKHALNRKHRSIAQVLIDAGAKP